MPGKLVLCATPIGNLEDFSERGQRVLAEADVLACENPARSRKLLSHFGLRLPQIVVHNEGTERRTLAGLVAQVAEGRTVVLVSDAGMPGLSDPGYGLVRACIDKGLPVEIVPGPSAAVSALAISGLTPARFVFEGFLPRKGGQRRRRIEELVDEPRTIVLYESPHRIEDCLSDLAGRLGPRSAVLARELTKLHEEVRRGSLVELLEGVRSDPPRGEIVVVIDGSAGKSEPEPPAHELARHVRRLVDEGVDRKEAIGLVAGELGVRRRRVFDALVTDPGKSGSGAYGQHLHSE